MWEVQTSIAHGGNPHNPKPYTLKPSNQCLQERQGYHLLPGRQLPLPVHLGKAGHDVGFGGFGTWTGLGSVLHFYFYFRPLC